MATDFFQRQDTARRNSAVLVGLFLLAVAGIVLITFFVVMFATSAAKRSKQFDGDGRTESNRSELPNPVTAGAIAAAGALVVIAGGTLFKVTELRSGGGKSVAESIGGQQLRPNHGGHAEQRLLNVVEEMAIASGTPVPPVFLMEDDAINAFAAGYAPGDAVIGVTRGACQRLSREELQGVIAHEFSHVLNGDMRGNIRLIGILHGILLLSLIGKMLLYSLYFGSAGRRRGRGNGKGMLVILAAGVALYLLGSLGALVGGLIKAGVSRQREYLADASAVQFTRNPDGIGGALMRIGAKQYGSRLKHPNAAVASHMYFAQGVFEGLSGLAATHPPLPKRIRAILPNWDGKFPEPEPSPLAPPEPSRPSGQPARPSGQPARPSGQPGAAARGFASGSTAAQLAGSQFAETQTSGNQTSDADRHVPGTRRGGSGGSGGDQRRRMVREAVGHSGHPEPVHQTYAARLLDSIPKAIREAAHEPSTARAIVVALLLDHDDSIRHRQLWAVGKRMEPQVVREAVKFWEQLADGSNELRLPLLDLTLPALACMSEKQFDAFAAAIRELIRADDRLSLFEWTLSQVLMRHLEPRFRPPRRVTTRYYSLLKLGRPVSVLLSTVARVGHSGDVVTDAFETARQQLPDVDVSLLAAEACSLDAVRESLDTLATVSAPRRRELVDACAAAICVDDHVTVSESELLRGIADLLECPIPPIVTSTA